MLGTLVWYVDAMLAEQRMCDRIGLRRLCACCITDWIGIGTFSVHGACQTVVQYNRDSLRLDRLAHMARSSLTLDQVRPSGGNGDTLHVRQLRVGMTAF